MVARHIYNIKSPQMSIICRTFSKIRNKKLYFALTFFAFCLIIDLKPKKLHIIGDILDKLSNNTKSPTGGKNNMNRIYVNNDWQFAYNFDEKLHDRDFYSSAIESVRLPHTTKELPFNYFSEEEYQTVSGYRKILYADPLWQGKRVLLTFEAVAHYAEVFLNGEKIGEHYSGYTAFTLDLSDHLSYGMENLLVVKVDSRECLNIPPFGNVIDYMTYGGIYREAYLEIKNPTYISDVFAKPQVSGELTCEIALRGMISEGMTLRQTAIFDGREIPLSVAQAAPSLALESRVESPALWHIDTPNLYFIRTELLDGGELLDTHEVKVGFRSAEFRKDGFYLNGEKLKIRGLNRHQSYPYVGYAMPKTMQEFDADVLKGELGLNTVRTSHYPQSHHFLNRCDEIGLMVITEIPGWQHIGDLEWQEQAVKNVEEMVTQYRNHPSIILWGVRINESQDNEALYLRTNALAHKLDPTRATGGIRNFKKSQLLEDVYTYNEFLHDGKHPGCDPKAEVTSDRSKPYMITEYNGHMFPTKSFDCEEHRVEHALRHARVLDAVASHDDIAGSCGWCMADYNTHKDFGSGDRICYHGVLDMFRNPKIAAAAYSSQGDAPMLEVGTSMDIGEHPACVRGNLWMFTNADSVKMYKNGRFIKEYFPKNKYFPHLKKSPILIDDFIGDAIMENESFKPGQAKTLTGALNYLARHGYGTLPPKILLAAAKCIILYGMKIQDIVDLYTKYAGDWGGSSREYRFDAIMQGKVVKSVTKSPMNKGSIKADVYKNDLLDGDCYDMTTIRITAVDEYGNLLNYSNEPISISVEGPAEIVGPSIVPLRGGMGGTYIKTTGKEGSATVTLSSPALGEVTLPLTVKVEK